jgi:hypothetical protein
MAIDALVSQPEVTKHRFTTWKFEYAAAARTGRSTHSRVGESVIEEVGLNTGGRNSQAEDQV